MITKAQWDSNISSFSKKLFTLYWEDGKLSLHNLNEFREITSEMDRIMQTLFRASRFPVLYLTTAQAVKKEIGQLSNEFTLMDYNLTQLAQVA